MDRFEYAIGLISLIVGLGLADIAISLHRLIKARGQVKWNGLALGTAAFAALMMIWIWYNIWSLRDFSGLTAFWFYLSMLLEMFLLFLAAAASLPDETELHAEDGRDLGSYYERQRGYIWTIFALFFAVYTARWLYFVIPDDTWSPTRWMTLAVCLGSIGLTLALARLPGRRMQIALLTALSVLIGTTIWNATL